MGDTFSDLYFVYWGGRQSSIEPNCKIYAAKIFIHESHKAKKKAIKEKIIFHFIQLLFKVNRLTQLKITAISIQRHFLQTEGVSWYFFNNKMLNNTVAYYKNLPETESPNQWQIPLRRNPKIIIALYNYFMILSVHVSAGARKRLLFTETIRSQQGLQRY